MMRIVTLAGAAIALSACTALNPFPNPGAPALAEEPGQIEPIHAVAIAQDQAVFWVSSNGCTAKGDLTPVVRRVGGQSIITLRRIKEDRCDAVRPEGVEVRWTFQELGLEPGARVTVENPYQLPQT